jgi:hypothetical protein
MGGIIMEINILKGFRQYSPEDLRSYAYRGLITCGSYDMSDFLEHIFQGMISEAEAERIALAEGERTYDEGYDVGYSEGWNACEIDRD